MRSLLKAGGELRCDELYVITNDYEASESVQRNGAEKTIHFIPLWQWLLTFTLDKN
jgi:predicted AAA+ superfamily ATPase